MQVICYNCNITMRKFKSENFYWCPNCGSQILMKEETNDKNPVHQGTESVNQETTKIMEEIL